MKIEQYHEENGVRFELLFQPRTLELASQLNDDLDLKADIRQVLQDAARAIAQLIHVTKRK